MCQALETKGFPGRSLRVLKPAETAPLGSVVIATPAVRNQFGTILDSSIAPAFIARFGSGKGEIDVRLIYRQGATALRDALNANLLGVKTAGADLLNDPRIGLSASARRQLADGDVDSRLLVVIATLAAQHPIDIVGFGNLAPGGASAYLPLRFLDLAVSDGAARSTAYRRSMNAVLGSLDPKYRPAHVEPMTLADGHAVFRIEFTAPTPLDLLGPTP
jgi:hypothetical protein